MNQRNPEHVGQSQSSNPTILSRIAFVQACWHKAIVDQCRKSFTLHMAERQFPESNIDFFEVPGSLEIPLHCQLLAKSGRYAAIVAAGFVVNGGIYRFLVWLNGALPRIQLETEVPIISAVLTPQSFHDHEEHRKFFSEHFVVKGVEAAVACAATIGNIHRLRGLTRIPTED